MAGETILVVDDNPSNSKLARIVLQEEGYVVHTAADAEQALRLVQTAPPRLILMDIQLPGMDGLELTRRLKSNDATRHIVILALTANALKSDEERTWAAGCDGYLTKPVDIEELAQIVAQHLSPSSP